jgi:hypothetical protein
LSCTSSVLSVPCKVFSTTLNINGFPASSDHIAPSLSHSRNCTYSMYTTPSDL